MANFPHRGGQKREIAWGSKIMTDSWKPTTGSKYVYDELQHRLKDVVEFQQMQRVKHG